MARNMLATAVASIALLSSVTALPTISVKGSKFFTSDGDQWYVKGVAYQLVPADPLADGTQCATDAALMKELGANAIRVYHVDPSLNHDACMSAFADAGIYAFIDLDTFSSEPTQIAPEWTPAQLGAYMYVMDAFQGYDNVAGFFIGNEIINAVGPSTEAAPYIRASTHDLKAYRDSQGYRKIPIGYSHADVAGLRPILQDYLVCGDEASSIEFFGLNAYEWCGAAATFESSGYANLLNQTLDFPVPIFLSETGCIVPEPRYFNDQVAVFTDMAGTWSGAIIYEWIQEANHYGIVTYGGGNTEATDYNIPAGGVVVSGTPTPISPDFANLQSHWATLNPTGVAMNAYNPKTTSMACPASTPGVWMVDPNGALPTLGINVAIPTASALALANWGLSSYTTPILGKGNEVLAPSTTLASVVAAATSGTTSSPTPLHSSTTSQTASSSTPSSSTSTNVIASSTIVATSTSIPASQSSSLAAVSSSANSVRSSIQSSANPASTSSGASGSGVSSNTASTTASGNPSSTGASAASASTTGAAVRKEVMGVGAGLAGLAAGAVLFL